jgi:hypothetical protein
VCKVCSTKNCTVGGTWDGQVGNLYYNRSEFNIENLPEAPLDRGFSGSSRTREVWKWPRPSGSRTIPQISLPSFTWKAGFPNNLDGCLYVFADISTAQLFGTACCGIDLGNVVCGSRSAVAAYAGRYRWRMMVLNCESESFQDVTGSVVTQIQPFEGEYNQLTTHPNRFCESIKSTAMPEYFPGEVPVVCA